MVGTRVLATDPTVGHNRLDRMIRRTLSAAVLAIVVSVAHVTTTLVRFGPDSQLVRWWRAGDPRWLQELGTTALLAFVVAWLLDPQKRFAARRTGDGS